MGYCGRLKRGLLILVLLALGCEDVAVVVPRNAPEPLRFGAGEIGAALKSRGIPYRRVESGGEDAQVAVTLGVAGPGNESVPKAPESYSIRKKISGKRWAVDAMGRDAAGAMYAALDLAEQFRGARSINELCDGLEERSKSPFLRIRGVNPFLLTDSLTRADSDFHSLDYWRKYLDLLARCRYNFLDLHACYDVMTTEFSNAFPYFIRSAAFPGATPAGVSPEKNLAMLRKITEMAKARGISVGLLNSVAGGVKVPPGRLAEYTRECAATLLRECPDLHMFGFRIGESGQKERFFKESYLAGVADAKREVDLYTRSWLAARSKVMEIGREQSGRFFVEIKYTGEHLGLPYIVAGNRVSGWGSCSYQAYSNYPRNYEIIYQIMANGTYRIFHWGDPDFARRCVRSCTLAEAAGFSMEPMTAGYPRTDYFINAGAMGKPFFTWAFERNWFWHMVWGRTAYDPDTPERVWIDAFKERFGGAAGESVYRAVTLSSKVVPLIYAYHCLGADRRRMAPELETGDDHRRRRLEDGGMVTDWQGDILDFVKVDVLDDTVMMSIPEYVKAQISGSPNGKLGPPDVAQMLSEYSLSAVENIEDAVEKTPNPSQEFRCICLDVEALRCLATYYAEKIRAATALECYRQTEHYEFLDDALKHAHDAIVAWGDLSEATARHYRPLIERLRMCTASFTWTQEGSHLSRDLLAIRKLRDEFLNGIRSVVNEEVAKFAKELGVQGQRAREEILKRHEEIEKRIGEHPPRIYHMPVARALPAGPIRIAATVVAVAERTPASLYYRNAGEKTFKKIPMSPRSEDFNCAAFIPAEDVPPGRIEYYIEAGRPNAAAFWPPKGPDAPQSVLITADTRKPVIEPAAIDEHARGDKLVIKAKITDESDILAAKVLYRPMPSFYEWQSLEMKKVDGLYAAEVPLTPEGLLIQYQAIDENGNVAIHPDALEQTPYYVVRGWAPAWMEHDFLSVQEGVETYRASAGGHPFTDSDLKIEAMSVDLKGLLGIRLPEKASVTASMYRGGGYVVRFKLSGPARMFVGVGRRDMRGWCPRQPGWVLLDEMELKVGKDRLDVCCRDYPAGEHAFAFAHGRGVILGFRPLKPDDKRIEPPFLLIDGEKDYDVLKEEYLTIPADVEAYSPKFGMATHTDRRCLIVTLPAELKGLLGIRFSYDRAKEGDFEIPFRLDVPARLYVAFAKPGTDGWEAPHADFTLYRDGVYKQSDAGPQDIYCKDFPIGQSVLVLKNGPAAILGFRKLSEVKKE